MDDLTLLVTGVGAPGTVGTIYSLKNNYDERKIRIIGTDMQDDIAGRYVCNKFYTVPAPETPHYSDIIIDICKKEKVNAIVPQTTRECSILSKLKDIINSPIHVSSSDSIYIANNKDYLTKRASILKIPVPKTYRVSNWKSLIMSAKKLGYPDLSLVVKPPASNGSRGVRIISEQDSNLIQKGFYTKKPANFARYLTIEQLRVILGETFPDLLIMEYISGSEYTADVLGHNRIDVIPRKRIKIKSGITYHGTVEKQEAIIEYSQMLTRSLGLQYAHGYQYILGEDEEPYLIECNPRIQGTMVLSTLAGANIIYGGIKHLLGEKIPEYNIDWNTEFYRLNTGFALNNNGITNITII